MNRAGEQGNAALEMAILAPLLLLILFAIIDWGWIFFQDISLANAVREGARVGVTKTLDEDPSATAQAVSEAYLANAGLDANATIETSFDQTELQVTGRMETSSLTGFLPDGALPGTLSSTTTMRWELAGAP